MQRLRLKADGRIVELRDGQEFPLAPAMDARASRTRPRRPAVRDLRRRAQLTQIEFAARLGVPVETIRNWEQGKRAPRGPARALLAVIAHSPETVFAALGQSLAPAPSREPAPAASHVGSAVPQDIMGFDLRETADAIRRSQRRQDPRDRAGHLGAARAHLRAAGRAGAAARLSPYRHRASL